MNKKYLMLDTRDLSFVQYLISGLFTGAKRLRLWTSDQEGKEKRWRGYVGDTCSPLGKE